MSLSLFNPFSDKSNRPTLEVMLGATMISFSGVYVKLAHVGPATSAFYRNLIGGIILSIIVLLKREQLWKDWRYFLLASLCGLFFALDMFLWHKSIHYVGPGLATLLANMQVFILAVVGVAVLRERLTFSLGLAIPLAMTGLYLIVGIQWKDLGGVYKVGVYCGILAAIFYAAFFLSLRKLQSMEGALSAKVNLVMVSWTSVLFLVFTVPAGGESYIIPDLQTLAALLAYGVSSQVLGWVLITKGLPGIRASLGGLLLLLQPSLSFVWDILFFNRATDIAGYAGLSITLAAIYLGSTSRSK